MCVCVCVCVCVCERERERVCVCVWCVANSRKRDFRKFDNLLLCFTPSLFVCLINILSNLIMPLAAMTLETIVTHFDHV